MDLRRSARRPAELLAGAVEPALRLALQEALAQSADELTAEIAPDRIELALHGSETGLRFVPAPEAATSTGERPARAAAMPGAAGRRRAPQRAPTGALPPLMPMKPPPASPSARRSSSNSVSRPRPRRRA